MKNLKYLLVGLVLIALTGCGDYFFDNKLDHETVITEKRTFEYKLTDADYKTISESKVAQALAAQLDAEAGEGSTVYTDALALVGANKSFNENATAKNYLTFALRANYPELDKGSLCSVTYNYEELVGEAPDASKLTYTGDTINVAAANEQLATLTPDHTADDKTVYVKDGENNKVFYVKGIVTSEKLDVSTQYGNATLYITDGTNKLYCYRIKDVDNKSITDAKRLQVGDVVVLKGNLGVYLASEGATPSYQLVNGSIVSVARTISSQVVEKTDIYVLAKEWIFSIYYQETFATGQGEYQIVNVNLGSLTQVWKHDGDCMNANGYNGGGTETWLISPELEVPNDSENPVLVYDHYKKYTGKFVEDCQVYLSEGYTTGTNAPDLKEWKLFEYTKDEPGASFVSTEEFDLSAYKGKKIYIGFRYRSGASAISWKIKNVTIREAE